MNTCCQADAVLSGPERGDRQDINSVLATQRCRSRGRNGEEGRGACLRHIDLVPESQKRCRGSVDGTGVHFDLDGAPPSIVEGDDDVDLVLIVVSPVGQSAANGLRVYSEVANHHALKVEAGGVEIEEQLFWAGAEGSNSQGGIGHEARRRLPQWRG